MLAGTLISLIGLLSLQQAKQGALPIAFARFPIAKYQPVSTPAPTLKEADRTGVEVTAKSAAVFDVVSGQMLFEKDADAVLPVASITKLVTAMTFLDMHSRLDEEVEVLPEDEDEDSKNAIEDHEKMTNGDLLQALLVGSVNKAANTMARVSGGKEAFVKAMNAKARSLNGRSALFVDPSGIHADNRASAREVAFFLRAALAYPEIREISGKGKIFLTGRASGRTYEFPSTDLLLSSYLNRDPYRILVGKTGSLPQAGFCLALATRFEQQHDVIAVALGSENHFARFQDVKALTTWAFTSHVWPKRAPVAKPFRGQGRK